MSSVPPIFKHSFSTPAGVDSSRIPRRKTPAGEIPVVGLGTIGSDRVSHKAAAESVLGAASAGFRHFDCASIYGNRKQIGAALNQIVRSGVPRFKLWINSKVWNNCHASPAVIDSCKRSLRQPRSTE